MLLISVIVPVYKVEKYLNRCIDSILAQTFTGFELILVDDGSPDNCGKICDEYSQKDNRIHVIHKGNGGLSDARNAGIDWAFENSDSEWITFIDSDDWIHPGYLEALFNAVKETGLSVSVCGYEITSGDNPIADDDKLFSQICNTEKFYCENNINATVAWGKLYRKECFKAIRYPVGKLHEDEFTTYKILFEYDEIAVIAEPLYFYFKNENSIMNSSWNPKRLVAADAIYEQIKYFQRNDLENALRLSLNRYGYYFVRLSQDNQIAENIKKLARKKLQKFIREFKDTGYISIKLTPWFYEYAYPFRMRLYWKIKNLSVHKMTRNKQ